MDSVSVGPTCTPNRAAPVGPSPPPRNSMEDADSSVTRKRPRLDSGDRAHRSMSADRTTATPSELGAARDPATPVPHECSPAAGERQSFSTVDRTPSKVTINVRDPLHRGSPPPRDAHSTSATIFDSTEHVSIPDQADASSSNMAEPSSPNLRAPRSSSPGSPEIEVAEVEDMNEDSGETHWRPLVSVVDATITQRDLLDQFPYADRNGDLRVTMSLIAQAFEKQSLENGHLLKNLADWFEMYLQTTEPHSSQWWGMYQEERRFWEEIPSLVDVLLRRCARYGATLIMPLRTDEGFSSRQSLESFLLAYTGLTSRMVQIDCQTLDDFADDLAIVPELVSHRYLNSWSYIASSTTSNFWRCLHETYRYDYISTITRLGSRFIQKPFEGIQCMSKIVKGFLDRSQINPGLAQHIWVPLGIVNRLMAHYNLLQESDDELQYAMANGLRQLPAEAYALFQTVDGTLQTFVSKQVTALSLEMSQSLVSQLSSLLSSVSHADANLTTAILRDKLHIEQEYSMNDAPIIVEQSWKFQLLKKCVMEGRMEIRVQGVESMQSELVVVYTKYVQNTRQGKNHPIAQFLSDFMLKNKLVEYFVGVDSHPQLLQRCPNVVGFLVITNRYTEAESDAIWKAVVTSQDSRVVDAVLTMLYGFFNISTYPILLYLTTKLNELPLHAFDNSMITYSERLLDHLRRTWKDQRLSRKMDMPPYNLCIRLIRQSAAEDSLPYHKKRDINLFALAQLQHLITFGPSDVDRKTIYGECVQDVACRSRFATGSVSAINALLCQNPEEDIQLLAKDADITTLLIEEFAHIIESESQSASTSQTLDERLTVRLELLQSIIIHIPDTIGPEIGRRLWDVMLGHRALSDRARNSAWAILGKASRCCLRRNSFIDRCISEHLPKLDPLYFTAGILSFVEQFMHYESRLARSRRDGDQFRAMGGELLWHLSLVAPSGTIERKAIHMLVALYLDSSNIQRAPLSVIEAMHIEVVERCIRQLTVAASTLKTFSDGTSSGEDEPMVIVASEEEVQDQRLHFTRSLLILKEFVHGVRSRPLHSPAPAPRLQLPQDLEEIKGIPINIRYQSFSGGTNTGIHSIEVGDLETVEELSQRLVTLTGFSKFIAISGGQRLNLNKWLQSTLREMKLEEKGLLIVKKAHEEESLPDLAPAPGLRPLEAEVMEHFSELYQFLDMEEGLAKEVFEFLVAFPPHASINTIVCTREISINAAFPPSSHFKVLYSIYALKLCLMHQLQNGTASESFIRHGVHLLSRTLTAVGVISTSLDAGIDVTTAAGLIDCLLTYLKEPVSTDVSSTFFADPSTLVQQLLWLISSAQTIPINGQVDDLVRDSFATLLEASLHSTIVWDHFKNASQSSTLLQKLLLEDNRHDVRQGVADAIRGICCSLARSATAPDFVLYFWQNCVAAIPQSLEHGDKSQQFFDVALVLFRSIDASNRENLDLVTYIEDWSDLLLKHTHLEFVGRESIDWVVCGISGLLNWSIQLTKSLKKPMNISNDLLEKLLRIHLFPEISNMNETSQIIARVPTLHSSTRQELYSIILALSIDMVGYRKLLGFIRELLPQGETSHAWSWGIAQALEEYSYETNWNFERSKVIRSPTGYPGLRNLSNTCYLNSLFTQLFMNVSFRGFMLNTNIADGNLSQKLLSETKSLFASMQETMLKQVDPQCIADSLITYDNALIDVSVQMDVDEFYNLLFDRWESQILSDEGKKTFRGFYGGQIVQQIKSKECPHISERIEPFSAIQCDIQGKASLTESLNAYVGGEVMEGDNKYSCTSCGCYVNAVKRACLKDIPDNLIFHLKRFDYDVMTGMRSKINDKFEFPEKIDMSPYHVDYLKDPQLTQSSDVFELVGILVHSGTAESGHYYSYIRERPVNPTQADSWVEFNDADVTRFNPAHIPDQCYGGLGDASPYSSACFPKAWNAYMLFYQRETAMKSEYQRLSPIVTDVPAKEKLSLEISNRIAIDNELFIRNYCLFDPAHATFAQSLLEQLRNLSKGTCSDDHAVEQEAIWLAMEHLDQVFSKAKDISGFEKMLASLARVIGACSHCCKLALDWVVNHKNALRNLLLKCPNIKVRKDFAAMVVSGLQYLRKQDTRVYGFDVDTIDQDPADGNLPELRGNLQNIISSLRELWTVIHLNARAWDDYFGLLVEIANFGVPETLILLREDFLKNCFEILVIEHNGARKLRSEYSHYTHYMRLIEKGRRFPLNNLIELMRALLTRIDLELNPVDLQHRNRPLEKGKVMLTVIEETYMRFGVQEGRSRSLVFLEKILNSDQNPLATTGIIRTMVLAEPKVGLLSDISKTILTGVNVEPASLAAPFLSAALVFCETSPTTAYVKDMIHQIAREVETIGLNGGGEHLDFFVRARRLQNIRLQRSPQFFNRTVLNAVPMWAPALLMYWEESVRMGTIDLLKTLVFDRDHRNMDNEQEADDIERVAKELCAACVKRIQDVIIQQQKPVETKSVENVSAVIRHCVTTYYPTDPIEDDHEIVAEAEAVLEALNTLTVLDVDDANSDTWNNQDSDLPTDSESENIMASP